MYVVAVLLVLSFVSVSAAATPEAEIRRAVSQHFGSIPDFRQKDLIRQQDLTEVIALLKETDLPLQRFAGLRPRIPADSSEIQQLKSDTNGRKFLRNVSDVPGGYAGIEDLASRPGGARDLRQLTKSPGGDEMIAYMTTTPGGKKLMSMTPKGKKSAADELPGPRIYTASQLYGAMVEVARKAAQP